MVQDLALICHEMQVIKNLAENEQAKTRVSLLVECEADVERYRDQAIL